MAEIIPFPRRIEPDDPLAFLRGLAAALFISVVLFWFPVALVIWEFVW